MTIKDKYPEQYFFHWLAMFSMHQDDCTDESINEQIGLYKNIEGKDEYKKLQEELKEIIRNDDLSQFLEVAQKRQSSDLITLGDLENMTQLMLAEG